MQKGGRLAALWGVSLLTRDQSALATGAGRAAGGASFGVTPLASGSS